MILESKGILPLTDATNCFIAVQFYKLASYISMIYFYINMQS